MDKIEPTTIVLFGGPGCGKGTQSKVLRALLGLPHISTGELFRKHREHARSNEITNGGLVGDELTEQLLIPKMRLHHETGFILDGYPRTLSQAEMLDHWASSHYIPPLFVMYLFTPEPVLQDRLSGRWQCPQCQHPYHERSNPPLIAGQCDECKVALVQRDDDRPEIVKRRLAVFAENHSALAGHYAGRAHIIDATQTPDVVTRDITWVITRNLAAASVTA